MECEVCGATPRTDHRVALFRVNPKGVDGVWRCAGCLTPEQKAGIDPEITDLVKAIQNE